MPYRYRCAQCRTTSPPAYTRRRLAAEQEQHRLLVHGGHIPDGEQIITAPRTRLRGLPREQRATAVFIVLGVLVAVLIHFG
jgi:hypothetical protein